MLDKDGRDRAAEYLRDYADTFVEESKTAAHARSLAGALEAEPEGYDYEWAATERGEALEALIGALRMADGPQSPAGVHAIPNTPKLRSALARGEEVMEGVQSSHVSIHRDTLRRLAAFVEAVGEELDGRKWIAETPEPIADALVKLIGLPGDEVIAPPDDEPRGAAERFAHDLLTLTNDKD